MAAMNASESTILFYADSIDASKLRTIIDMEKVDAYRKRFGYYLVHKKGT